MSPLLVIGFAFVEHGYDLEEPSDDTHVLEKSSSTAIDSSIKSNSSKFHWVPRHPPSQMLEPFWPDSNLPDIVASRIFAGPNQYPPRQFAAYGILAFRSRATSNDRARHMMLCEAYIASLPHSYELRIPYSEQMVTVWPILSDEKAEKINKMRRVSICAEAVDNYDLVTSLSALKTAELAGTKIIGIGPFLLAWSPSTSMGKRDILVLNLNLSNVTTYEQALAIFNRWSRDIEQDPELWKMGWNVEKLRLEIQLWVDEYGTKILDLFGSK